MVSAPKARLSRFFRAARKAAAAVPQTERSVPTFESLEERIAFSIPGQLAADMAMITGGPGAPALPDGNPAPSYAVLGLAGCKMDMSNPQTTIAGPDAPNFGDVGIGPGGVQNFSDGQIKGKLVLDYTANNTHSNNVKIMFGTHRTDLTSTCNAAIDASNIVAHLNVTQTVPNINGSMTLFAPKDINVINTNSIVLNGGQALTLKGGSQDYFFINVTGKFSMNGNSQILLTGGITTSHVIINILGTGEQVAFTGSAVAVGTIFADNRDIADAGATVNGVLVGAMNHQISIVSGSQVQVNSPHFSSVDFGTAASGYNLWDNLF
jgi:hypothetical protein